MGQFPPSSLHLCRHSQQEKPIGGSGRMSHSSWCSSHVLSGGICLGLRLGWRLGRVLGFGDFIGAGNSIGSGNSLFPIH